MSVIFECLKVSGKLRVRIITPGYNQDANCQFPRDIRQIGRFYSAPASMVKMARGPAGKFFYRVNDRSRITILQSKPVLNKEDYKFEGKVYESDMEECLICMENPHDVILVPCGHYCLCKECSSRIGGKCPLCRSVVDLVIGKEMI